MMEKQIVFVLGDRLPTYYDAAISISNVSTQKKGQHMKKNY